MPGGQFSHFRDKMSLARDTVGQFRDDPGHSGTVGKPTPSGLRFTGSTVAALIALIHTVLTKLSTDRYVLGFRELFTPPIGGGTPPPLLTLTHTHVQTAPP